MAARKKKELQASALVLALEIAWNQIRTFHFDIPAAVIVVASGSMGRQMKAGHFAQDRWTDGAAKKKKGAKAATVHEVLIGGEHLKDGGAAVMDTLLHEGAHGVATVRGVADTSRGGRYHNKRFKALAEELGLSVTVQGSHGWADTELTKQTRKLWAKEIRELDKAIAKSFRIADPEGDRKPVGSRMLKAQCQCISGETGDMVEDPRTIRIARKVFDLAAITCGECECDFELCEGEG